MLATLSALVLLATGAPAALAQSDAEVRTVFTADGPSRQVLVNPDAQLSISSIEVKATAPEPPPQTKEEAPWVAEVMSEAQDLSAAMRTRAVDVSVFPNGVIPRQYLCHIPWTEHHWLECEAAADLVLLDARWRIDHGDHISFTDSYRTLQGQYDCQAAKGSMCATPGTSNHGWGRAVDFAGGIETYGSAAHEWMWANAPDFGWINPEWARPWGSKPEPWHWEHTGTP